MTNEEKKIVDTYIDSAIQLLIAGTGDHIHVDQVVKSVSFKEWINTSLDIFRYTIQKKNENYAQDYFVAMCVPLKYSKFNRKLRLQNIKDFYRHPTVEPPSI